LPGAPARGSIRRGGRRPLVVELELSMLEWFPGFLLVVMIVLTLILLPYLNEDRQRTPERTGRTEELHIKHKHDV
jgi:hypothetical protein